MYPYNLKISTIASLIFVLEMSLEKTINEILRSCYEFSYSIIGPIAHSKTTDKNPMYLELIFQSIIVSVFVYPVRQPLRGC